MSAVTIENDLVHYEVLGRGRPVILLHGWLSSWRYWMPSMQQLSLRYRTYALDLWGYGDSGKDAGRLTLDAQVRLLSDFLDKLGISKVALVGHSLGAAVAIRYARRHPERVARLMVISPPVFESDQLPHPDVAPPADPAPATAPPPAPHLRRPAAGPSRTGLPTYRKPAVFRRQDELEQRLAAELARQGITLNPNDPIPRLADLDRRADATPATPSARDTQEIQGGASPLRERLFGSRPGELLALHLEREHPEYERLLSEAAKTAPEALSASVLSFDRVDLAYDLRRLTSPTFLLHGQLDALLPPPSESLIAYMQGGKHSLRCEIAPSVGHFPMLTDPANFNRLMMDFLEVGALADLVLQKERWIRKVR